jgi:hypothetical protein
VTVFWASSRRIAASSVNGLTGSTLPDCHILYSAAPGPFGCRLTAHQTGMRHPASEATECLPGEVAITSA